MTDLEKKRKGGWVYDLKCTSPSGRQTQYTGMTRRSVYKRVGEHIDNVKSQNTKHYTGRQARVQVVGSFYSNNPAKAEQTVKRKRREGFWSW